MTPQEIREANNGFPSQVQRIYNLAADTIERLEEEKQAWESIAVNYESYAALLEHRINELTACLPASNVEVQAATEALEFRKEILQAPA